MCDILINDLFDELRDENKRLLTDLTFERNLRENLENFKNYALVLLNSCKCNRNTDVIKKLNELQISYANLKLIKIVANNPKISKQNVEINCANVKQDLIEENVVSIAETIQQNNELNCVDVKQETIEENVDSITETITKRQTKRNTKRQKLRQNSNQLSEMASVVIQNANCIDFRCNQCEHCFESALDLQIHCNRDHRNIDSFVCLECQYIFNTKEHLSAHISQTHRKEALKPNSRHYRTESNKLYKCDLKTCGKSFNYSYSFLRHKLIHAKIKPFVCDYDNCLKSFTQKTHLMFHKSSHIRRRDKISGNCSQDFVVKTLPKRKLRHRD